MYTDLPALYHTNATVERSLNFQESYMFSKTFFHAISRAFCGDANFLFFKKKTPAALLSHNNRFCRGADAYIIGRGVTCARKGKHLVKVCRRLVLPTSTVNNSFYFGFV